MTTLAGGLPTPALGLRHVGAAALAACLLAGACGPPHLDAGVAAPAGPAALLVEPDDGTAAVIEAMRAARRRVRLAMYLLTSDEAIGALAAARAGGADVAVLLERSPYGAADANQPAYAALGAAGVDARWVAAPRGLLHAKLLIVDGATTYVMSMNFTRAGLATNREYAVVDQAAADVRRAEALWQAAATGAPADPAAGAGTRLVASGADARPRLTAAIDGALASIAVEMEELSDAALVDHLVAAAARGVSVQVVAPAADRSAATDRALAALAAGGVDVRALAAPTVHAKAMVIDGRRVYAGSINFTRASLDDNREAGFLTDDPAMAARIGATIAADAAAAAPL